MDPLTKIFQSNNGEVRLRILRFFLVNRKDSFRLDDIEFNIKCRRDSIKKDLVILTNSGFLERYLDNKNISVYRLNNNFKYINTLNNLVFDFKSLDKDAILARFKKR